MKKRFLVLMMALVAVCLFALTPQKAEAATIVDSGTCGDNLTWTLDDEGTLTISGTGKIEDYGRYEYGDFFDDFYDVYYHNPPWGAYLESITSIVIEPGVTSIGVSAFANGEVDGFTTYPPTAGCANLTSVVIPEGVVSIDSYAFYGSGLTSITIPESVIHIEEWAFEGCKDLKDVYYGGSEVQWNNIYNKGLENVTLHFAKTNNPDTYAVDGGTCGDHVIWILDNEGTLTISGTGEMKDYANVGTTEIIVDSPWYDKNTAIKEVVIRDGVTNIGENAFAYCTSLTSITIPDSVTSIGDYAFEVCYKLTSITIGNGVTSIGKRAFGNCNSLTSVTIPDSVTIIGDYAFWDCTSLTSVTIGNGVTSIGNSAFRNCTSLTSITIPDSVTSIGESAFRGCTSLTSATIGNSVTSIGNDAFYNCSNLTSVTIGSSVTRIGSYAFRGCNGLTSIAIPDSVTSIGSYAFWDCTSLTNITIPSVTSIGMCTFWDCTSLTSVTIGNSVNSIWGSAFSGCTSLTNVYYGGSEEQWNVIDIYAGNEDLTDATIHYNYIPSVANGTFGKANLAWTLDSDGLLTISGTGKMKDYSFTTNAPWYSYRDSIKNVVIVDGVKSIGRAVFYECSNLTSITIPISVTLIRDSVFTGCTSLADVYYADNASHWKLVSVGGENAPLETATMHYADNPCVDDANDTDHLCDVCGMVLSACKDKNNDHKCDVCGKVLNSCTDSDDHKCDVCGKVLSTCADSNDDHKCDLCGKILSSCADNNNDHKCDTCGKVLSSCADNNNDHKCDTCSVSLSACVDEDNDHKCDICFTLLSECADKNMDHNCDTCGLSVSKCTDANEDMFCDICGVILPGMIDDPRAKFSTTGLSLGSFIGMQSAIVKSTMNSGNFDEAYFIYAQYTTDENGVLNLVAVHEGTYIDMGSYFVSECPVNAKQMSDVYEITPYYVKDGITYRGATTTTSVKAEAMKTYNKATTDDKTKALCVAMLNYGAEAQKKFAYNLDNLANKELADELKALPVLDDLGLTKVNNIPTVPFKPASAGLSLGDVVYMQFLIAKKNVDANGTVSYQIGSEAPVETAVADLGTYGSSYYVIEIALKAKYVRSDVVISVPAVAGSTYTMTCSVEGFATNLKGSTDETLVTALMAYGDAAKAVFG